MTQEIVMIFVKRGHYDLFNHHKNIEKFERVLMQF